jgi:hypothetical protein
MRILKAEVVLVKNSLGNQSRILTVIVEAVQWLCSNLGDWGCAIAVVT